MKKLKLEMDELRVESFQTTAAGGAARGTVRGNNITHGESWDLPCIPDDGNQTLDPALCATQVYTCAASCNGTCNSCYGTCYSCYGTCYGSCQPRCDSINYVCEPLQPEV
jgi:hypothetical protein